MLVISGYCSFSELAPKLKFLTQLVSKQKRVVFAGSGSLKPPSQAFNNPLVLSVQISEYGNFSDKKTLKSQLSIEFDRYEVVSHEDSHLFTTPPGTICEGWKESNIPRNMTDPFNAFVEMVDENKKKYESTVWPFKFVITFIDFSSFSSKVYYSAKEELVIVNGYEYSLDSTPCLRPLPNDSADVISSEGTLSMRPIGDILIAPELKFGNYGQVKTDANRTLDVFRAFDNRTGSAVEVHFDGNWLEKYIIFKVGFTVVHMVWFSR
ncbi:hypothetical protein TELCIR_02362 [Teladorsagia circumcincta]|uniref:LolA-like domain-containing protein n=1 Tax=Teladorsagia circumcincta TaxID=45464 RepID=A0A2G9UZM2_TELCI|nr:hypothetical protein TELCIR_02362 [Teladorsagia circumcincta]